MMEKKIEYANLVKKILEEESEIDYDLEELIHMLIDKQVTENVNKNHSKTTSMGDHIADKLAEVAGSWSFIIGFACVLVLWISINTFILATHAYDPYPFILLNLILSCLAAIQAPVIMMSQNRQEKKDRLRAENDYRVNLKSEIIIEDLHFKLDTLIQQQTDMLNKISGDEKRNL